jgi:hypothetical protein
LDAGALRLTEHAAARELEERGMVVFPTRRLYELEASTVQAQGVDDQW